MSLTQSDVERHDGEEQPQCVASDWCCGCAEHPIAKPWGWNHEEWARHYAEAHPDGHEESCASCEGPNACDCGWTAICAEGDVTR